MTTGSLLLQVKGERLTVSAHHSSYCRAPGRAGADGPSVVSAKGGVT